MTDLEINQLNESLKPEYFSLQSCTFHVNRQSMKNQNKHSREFREFAEFIRNLSVVHHRCCITLIGNGKLGKKPKFISQPANSVEECLCHMFQIQRLQLKTIECSCPSASNSRVSCTFVIPQMEDDMSEHQIKWQQSRVVVINNEKLQVGYLADVVALLFEPIWYKNLSYFLNITLGDSDFGFIVAGLLSKCCKMVVDFCKNEIKSFRSLVHDEVLSEQFHNFVDSEKVTKKGRNKQRLTKTLHEDLEAVLDESEWAMNCADGGYQWAIHKNLGRNVIKRTEDDEINVTYRKQIEKLIECFADCENILDEVAEIKSAKKQSSPFTPKETSPLSKDKKTVALPKRDLSEPFGDCKSTVQEKVIGSPDSSYLPFEPNKTPVTKRSLAHDKATEHIESPPKKVRKNTAHDAPSTSKAYNNGDDIDELLDDIATHMMNISTDFDEAPMQDEVAADAQAPSTHIKEPADSNEGSSHFKEPPHIDASPHIEGPREMLKKEKLAIATIGKLNKEYNTNGLFLNDATPVQVTQGPLNSSQSSCTSDLFDDDFVDTAEPCTPLPEPETASPEINEIQATPQQIEKKKRAWLNEPSSHQVRTPSSIQPPIDSFVTRRKKDESDADLRFDLLKNETKNDENQRVFHAKQAVAERQLRKEKEKQDKFSIFRKEREKKQHSQPMEDTERENVTFNSHIRPKYDLNSNEKKPSTPATVIDLGSSSDDD